MFFEAVLRYLINDAHLGGLNVCLLWSECRLLVVTL